MHMLHNKTSKYMKQKSIRVNGGYSTPFSAIDKNDWIDEYNSTVKL